jgi:hypothetical protein
MRACVVKRATAWATVDRHGRDARDRLRHEAAILARLGAAGLSVPTVRDVVTEDDDLLLVMDQMPGVPLSTHVHDTNVEGGSRNLSATREIGSVVAQAVQRAHDAGVILRDLSASNILVEEHGRGFRIHLIDFEVAYGVDDRHPPFDRGTLGVAAPSHYVHVEHPDPSDDVFSLGALLWLMATGRHTASEPGLDSLSRHRLLLAAAGIDDGLADLIISCLSRQPDLRPVNAAAVATALEHTTVSHASVPSHQEGSGVDALDAIEKGFSCARRSLLADLRAATEDKNCAMDIANGLAGLVLAAATLAELFDDEECAEAARAGGSALQASDDEKWPVPGLFVGQAGIGAVLCHPILRSDSTHAAAIRLASTVRETASASSDLMNGTAGVVRGLLVIANSTHNTAIAAFAEEHAAHLVDEIHLPPHQRWTLTPEYGNDAGAACLGYAHGAAGIADVLVDLHQHTGDSRWLDAATSAVAGLLDSAVRSTNRIGWPHVVGGDVAPPVWCRGAGGASILLARLGHAELATEALNAVASAAWTSPNRCHGLAGQVELLIDARRLHDAMRLAELLVPYVLSPSGDSPASATWLEPGLLEGAAGVAIALARCLRPDHRPWSRLIFGSYTSTQATQLD